MRNHSYRGELSRTGQVGFVAVFVLSEELVEEDVAVFPGDFEGAALARLRGRWARWGRSVANVAGLNLI